MKTVFRYRRERHFAQPPEAIWSVLAKREDERRVAARTG